MPGGKNLKKTLMEKIEKEEIKMKPRWHFIIGSILLFLGFLSATIFSILSINLIFFLMRKHYGAMYQYRLNYILTSFPWWLIIPSVLGIFFGLRFLKEYRFSYKNNFLVIVFGYILVIFLSAFLIDFFNLNSFFNRFGRRKFHQKYNIEKNQKFWQKQFFRRLSK